jgi:hypothetical protein
MLLILEAVERGMYDKHIPAEMMAPKTQYIRLRPTESRFFKMDPAVNLVSIHS